MQASVKRSSDILRIRQVIAQLGISRSAIYDWMDPKSPRYDKTFPKPIRLGRASIGWLSIDIESFISSRIALRDKKSGSTVV